MNIVGVAGALLVLVGITGARKSEDFIAFAVSLLVSAIGGVVLAIGVVLHVMTE